ncbi:putative farnesyl pyrophosphate synthase [Cryptosporidium canis]|nr:putative farnesyl pyrophosphate synthase [Cryptosporidium canis]
MSNVLTPIRNTELNGKKRISYSLSNNRKKNLQKLIAERNIVEKNEVINRLGGALKATSIESQIVCLERDQLVDLLLIACAEYPDFCKKIFPEHIWKRPSPSPATTTLQNLSFNKMDTLLLDSDFADFIDYYDKFKALVYSVLNSLPLNDDIKSQVIEYYMDCIEYNVKNGKHVRGKILVSVANLTQIYSDEKKDSIYLLGWVIETIQAFILIADDIMDSSRYRRGKPCWYITHGQPNGINDIFFLKMLSISLISELSSAFGEEVTMNLQKIYNEAIFLTVIGQHLDLSAFELSNVEQITKNYYSMVEMKTSRYSFYMPVMIGLALTGIKISDMQLSLVKTILSKLGEYYQVHNDMTDYLTNDNEFDDIFRHKLTWPLQKSMEVADKETRTKIIENYGKNRSIVKECYNSLNISEHYLNYRNITIETLNHLSNGISDENLKRIIIKLIKLLTF